jgi:dTMP kinase
VNRKREPNSVTVLLRIPVFRRLWAAIAISSLGDWLGLLATTALAAYLTKDSSNLAQGAAVSGVLLTRLLPDLVLGPIAGALVDRFDRRKVAVAGDCLAGLLYVSIVLSGNLLWLLVAQFLVEAIGLFSTPAKQAMWVNIVPRERLAVANQLNYVSVYGMVPVAASLFVLLSTAASFFGAPDVSGAAGTALISGSTNTLAIDVALVIDAGTYFFSAAMVFFSRRLIPAFVGDRSTSKNIFSLIAEGVSFVRKNRLMRSIYIGILGAFFAGGLVAGVAQAYVATLGAGNAGYGILFGSVFTGLALGMLIGPKVLPTVPRRMIFTPAIGAAGLSLIVMSVMQDFVGAVLAATVMGVFAGIAWINGFTMIGHEVTDQLRGRVFAFVMSSVRIVLLATIAAGPVLAGAIGSYPVTIGEFRFEVTGPAIVLAVGGMIAFGVSLFAGRQIGGLTSGLVQRIFGRRGVNIWDEQDDHAGVLLAIEGADPVALAEYAGLIDEHLRSDGWLTVRIGHPAVSVAGGDSGASRSVGLVDEHSASNGGRSDAGQPVRDQGYPKQAGNGQSAGRQVAGVQPAGGQLVAGQVGVGQVGVGQVGVGQVGVGQVEVGQGLSGHRGGQDSPADALRASADLADLVTERIRPALQAGAVVVCEGFVDATIVAHRAAGVEEQRLARVAQWAVNGLKPDLTVVVDGVVAKNHAVKTDVAAADRAGSAGAGSAGAVPAGAGSADAVGGLVAANGAVAEPGVPTAKSAGTADDTVNSDQQTIALDVVASGDSVLVERTEVDGVADGKAAGTGGAKSGTNTARDAEAADAELDEDEPVDPVQAYRDRASYAPERYLIVRPVSEEGGMINPEIVERISSVLRQRSPALAEPQPAS